MPKQYRWTDEDYIRHCRERAVTPIKPQRRPSPLLVEYSRDVSQRLDEPAKRGRQAHKRVVGPRGLWFDSETEKRYAEELELRERAGEIESLILDKHELEYPFFVNSQFIGKYTADFRYIDLATGAECVGDVKPRVPRRADGTKIRLASRGEAYGLRKRMMLAFFGIAILEIER